MPIYTYKCDCGNQVDEFRHINQRHDAPLCCGESMRLAIQPTMLQPVLGGGDWDGYQCPVTDEFVTSRKRRKDIMKEHNLVEKDPKPVEKSV